jgi:hypothetical protein
MNSDEASDLKEKELTALQSKLNEFLQQYSITKFESEDILELISEGEGIDWIVDQLRGSNSTVNAEPITALLKEIYRLIHPDTERQQDEAAAASTDEAGIVDTPPEEVTHIDMSQLSEALPPGVKLPPGLNEKEIKNLIESPQGQIMSDFLLFCQEKGADLGRGNLNDPRIRKLQNEWQSTPRDAFDGKTPAEMLQSAQGKVETFRREEPRIGRNDPCPCGSGKKYKKCCGRVS